MPETYKAEKTLTAVFKEENQIQDVIQRLIQQGVSQEHISVMGKNFESQTRIAGFISKKDVILGGLRTGAVFGSLFGSILSLFTGVGVLFIPFIGSIVAAGPISSVLLGAATGALAGSAGAGLASALATLGMPEDKAAVYETSLKAGDFLFMVEVSADKVNETQQLIESAGGQELHVSEQSLPRPCAGRCNSPEDLSPEIRTHLSPEAQKTFIERYNTILDETNEAMKAEQAAWETIHQQYQEDEKGVWSKAAVGV